MRLADWLFLGILCWALRVRRRAPSVGPEAALGLVFAYRATRISPVEALRYE